MHRHRPGYRSLRFGRVSRQGQVYHITFATQFRRPWFRHPGPASDLCRCICHPNSLADARNLCYVVMPDHVHILLELGKTPMERVINRLKSRSAVMLNRTLERNGRLWSMGYYDHAIRSDESLRALARYVIANPLRAGLVERVGDYPFWNAIWL